MTDGAATPSIHLPQNDPHAYVKPPPADLSYSTKPLRRRAPSCLLSVNLSRAPANASFTNALLPITAPSVKNPQ